MASSYTRYDVDRSMEEDHPKQNLDMYICMDVVDRTHIPRRQTVGFDKRMLDC